MRSLRLLSGVLASALVLSVAVGDGSPAQAQSVGETENDAAEARQRAEVASGLVDEAVAERGQIEIQLTETITRVNDLAARLSVVGAGLDRTAEQLGYADVELAGIRSQIEVQAVDAYMTVLSSPTATVVNSASVEEALVASTVVEVVPPLPFRVFIVPVTEVPNPAAKPPKPLPVIVTVTVSVSLSSVPSSSVALTV